MHSFAIPVYVCTKADAQHTTILAQRITILSLCKHSRIFFFLSRSVSLCVGVVDYVCAVFCCWLLFEFDVFWLSLRPAISTVTTRTTKKRLLQCFRYFFNWMVLCISTFMYFGCFPLCSSNLIDFFRFARISVLQMNDLFFFVGERKLD